MRVSTRVKRWIYLSLSAMLVHISVASAQAVDIPLGTPDGFSANAIDPIGNDRHCVSGDVFDEDGPSRSTMVVMVDAHSRRALWRTAIPYRSDYASNSAVACGSDGHSIYALTEDHTQSSESLSQTRGVVNRISLAGKLEKRQPIQAGFDE